MFTGFRDRMENELTKLVPSVDFKVDVEAPKERVYTEWQGGSILSSLSTFQPYWMSK